MGIESTELALELEARFGVELPNRISKIAAIHDARTVGELEAVVLRLRREQLSVEQQARLSPEEVRAELRRALSKVFGDPPEFFTPELQLVDDLGMDQ